MTAKKVTIGVLGCANIADRSVIPAIKSLSEKFELVAVASRSFEKAALFAKRYNCEAIGSYSDIIERSDIGALYIPLPTGLHKEWIDKALRSGKHVYAEKSIALTYNDAQKMVGRARQSQVALMEGYMFQYHTQHAYVKGLIDQGIIGEIRHFSGSFGFPPLPTGNFRYDAFLGGGVLFDAAGYPLKAAGLFLGDQLTVSGASLFWDPLARVSLYGSAYLTGLNGVGAFISFGFDNYYQCCYQIWGSKGKITVERAYTIKPDEVPTITLETNGTKENINLFPDNHFIGAMHEFHRIIFSDEKEKHYRAILQQSNALEKIQQIAKPV